MDILVGSLTNAIKEHSKVFGVVGAVMGAALVIAYCGSIDFYPSGLTIADTLFFIWVIVVFGVYYSVIVFGFFVASVFWVAILTRPLNFAFQVFLKKNRLVIPFKKADWFLVLFGGFFANVLIVGVSYFKEHPLTAVFGVLLFVGFAFVLISNISRFGNTSGKILDHNGSPTGKNQGSSQSVKYIFYAFIYFAPILYGQVGSGVTRVTFETMGVRQENVSIYVEQAGYRSILTSYQEKGLVSSVVCDEICAIENVDILFTSIGSNSKIEMHGENGSLSIVLPTKDIKFFAYPKPKKPIDSNTDNPAAG
jgi:Dolichyl-phosphate-mannose--protein O-mannosyl transferase